jgi:hypothetical protein
VEEREARKKVALAAARREADRTDVLARAWAEGRVLGKEVRREDQEKLRRQWDLEAVDEPCWPEGEKLRRVKRAEEAVDAVKAKAVKAEVKAAVVLAQAWAQEARARVEGLLLREELRREEKEKDEETDEEQDGGEQDEEQDCGGSCEEKEEEQDGGEGGVVQRGEERERDEARRAVRDEIWKSWPRLSSEGLLPRLDSRTRKTREELWDLLVAALEESARRRVEEEMRQIGERRVREERRVRGTWEYE